MCVIFVSESKFLKWKYFDFVCEFQIIEKYSSGKGKEVLSFLYSKCVKNGLTR